jgi:hypothetical protein
MIGIMVAGVFISNIACVVTYFIFFQSCSIPEIPFIMCYGSCISRSIVIGEAYPQMPGSIGIGEPFISWQYLIMPAIF